MELASESGLYHLIRPPSARELVLLLPEDGGRKLGK